MKAARRKKKLLVPRLGPPQNLRPAGAHESKKRYNRKRAKAALEQYDEGGFSHAAVWANGEAGIRQCDRKGVPREPLSRRTDRDVDRRQHRQ